MRGQRGDRCAGVADQDDSVLAPAGHLDLHCLVVADVLSRWASLEHLGHQPAHAVVSVPEGGTGVTRQLRAGRAIYRRHRGPSVAQDIESSVGGRGRRCRQSGHQVGRAGPKRRFQKRRNGSRGTSAAPGRRRIPVHVPPSESPSAPTSRSASSSAPSSNVTVTRSSCCDTSATEVPNRTSTLPGTLSRNTFSRSDRITLHRRPSRPWRSAGAANPPRLRPCWSTRPASPMR